MIKIPEMVGISLFFTALAASGPAAPARLQVDPGGRFLVRSDGTPLFWLGDTAWWLLRLTDDEIRDYLANRARKGFTGVQVDLNPMPGPTSCRRERSKIRLLQTGHIDDLEAAGHLEVYTRIAHDYNLTPVKPVFDGEPAYEDMIDGYWQKRDLHAPRREAGRLSGRPPDLRRPAGQLLQRGVDERPGPAGRPPGPGPAAGLGPVSGFSGTPPVQLRAQLGHLVDRVGDGGPTA